MRVLVWLNQCVKLGLCVVLVQGFMIVQKLVGEREKGSEMMVYVRWCPKVWSYVSVSTVCT